MVGTLDRLSSEQYIVFRHCMLCRVILARSNMSVRPHPNALTCTGALIDSLPSRTISFAA